MRRRDVGVPAGGGGAVARRAGGRGRAKAVRRARPSRVCFGRVARRTARGLPGVLAASARREAAKPNPQGGGTAARQKQARATSPATGRRRRRRRPLSLRPSARYSLSNARYSRRAMGARNLPRPPRRPTAPPARARRTRKPSAFFWGGGGSLSFALLGLSPHALCGMGEARVRKCGWWWRVGPVSRRVVVGGEACDLRREGGADEGRAQEGGLGTRSTPQARLKHRAPPRRTRRSNHCARSHTQTACIAAAPWHCCAPGLMAARADFCWGGKGSREWVRQQTPPLGSPKSPPADSPPTSHTSPPR